MSEIETGISQLESSSFAACDCMKQFSAHLEHMFRLPKRLLKTDGAKYIVQAICVCLQAESFAKYQLFAVQPHIVERMRETTAAAPNRANREFVRSFNSAAFAKFVYSLSSVRRVNIEIFNLILHSFNRFQPACIIRLNRSKTYRIFRLNQQRSSPINTSQIQ